MTHEQVTGFAFRPFLEPTRFLGRSFCFLRAFFRAPRSIGSVCESSPFLTKALVAGISPRLSGTVVDLGAGTGVVTRQLLSRGYPMEQIIAVEKSPTLAGIMEQTWPGLRIIKADAVTAMGALRLTGVPVSAVLSSLPLRLFSAAAVRTVLREAYDLLPEGGRFVQYSYAFWKRFPLLGNGFSPVASTFVPGNLPPARVEVYERQA